MQSKVKEEKEIKKMGRPEITLDWEKIDNLLITGSSGAQVAAHLGIHHDTLYDRIADKYGKTFSDYSREKRQKGDSMLLAKQFEKAMKGDNMMLIWLGKNRLSQKDKEEEKQSPNDKKLDELLSDVKLLKEKNAIKPKADPEL